MLAHQMSYVCGILAQTKITREKVIHPLLLSQDGIFKVAKSSNIIDNFLIE